MYSYLSKIALAGIALAATISGSGATQSNLSAINPGGEMESAAIASNSSATAKDSLDSWLDQLAELESHNRGDLKILDHNNLYSYGCLQFQMPTFKEYVRKYDLLPNTEDSELENVIYDCSFQKTLARKMILDNPSNWQHWYLSVSEKGLGIPPKEIELAKK